ncbi:hypothetical protein [Nonomuraea sp. B19D2]|uniref:hypothetical protein n=1 Tax=Nonomuraea sp. B19D2 TaxID=3159561 RepID=UPI0032DB5800
MADWPRTVVELATPQDVAAGVGGVYTSSYNLSNTAEGVMVLPGMKGFDAPAFTLFHDEMPALDGGYLRHVRAPARQLFIPVVLTAPDRPGLLALKRGFLASLNPMNGPCRITFTEGDGSRRFIDAYYYDGATGSEGTDDAGFLWVKYGLVFRALDPYFYAGVSQSIRFTTGNLQLNPFFGDPFLNRPLLNKAHSLNGESTITITGDVDTYPTWTIHGPTTGMTFTRQIAGQPDQSFSLNTSLSETRAVIVDTRPRSKSVRDAETGENLWQYLGPSPHLWPVAPGTNKVVINIDGVGGETSVTLSYLPRFISA